MRNQIETRGNLVPKNKSSNKMSLLAKFLMMLVALQISAAAFAQTKTISGSVSDESGELLPGVTVIVKGTTTGTITDVDGRYMLSNVPPDAILLFSFIGLANQEIAVADKSKIDAVMKMDNLNIEEVVAIGYGTTTKRKLVGAVSSVSAEDLEGMPVSSAGQALQGRAAGVIVNSYGGAPGALPKIRIRGDSGDKPLYVIDGVPMDLGDEFTFGTINMKDIESISFLKDASACSVYGSRASGGIVLITTKKGASGKMKINYSADYRWVTPTVRPERIDGIEYAYSLNKAYEMEGQAPLYSDEEIEKIRNGTDPISYPNTDWYDLMLKDYATEKSHNLSLSGGNEITKYYVSMNYFDQGGLLLTDQYSLNRFNIRSNITSRFEKIGLELGIGINASLQNMQSPVGDGYWTNIYYAPPNIYAYNPDGTISAETQHPMEYISESAGYEKQKKQYISSQVNAKWDIPWIEGLSIGGLLNYRDDGQFDKRWLLSSDQYTADGVMKDRSPSMTLEYNNSYRLNYEANIAYNKTFLDDHTISLTGVFVQNQNSGYNLIGQRSNYVIIGIDELFAGEGDVQTADGGAREGASMGYVGRMKYDFASKYILELNCRYDGNDNYRAANADEKNKVLGVFPAGPRWGFFPSISASWVASEEGFMQSLQDVNALNMLKFRASYGTTGYSNNGTRYQHLTNYQKRQMLDVFDNSQRWSDRVSFVADGLLTHGFYEPYLPSLDLSWWTTKSVNTGIDFASLNNKLEGTFDFFYNRTSGYAISPQDVNMDLIGLAPPKVMADSTARRKHGFEFSIRYKEKIGEVSFDVGFNFTHYNQLWERKQDAANYLINEPNPRKRLQQQKDSWGLGYVDEGLYQDYDALLSTPRNIGAKNVTLGDIRYQDINGDGQITQEDMVNLGLPEFPHNSYGIDLNANWRFISFGALITGTGERLVKHDWRSYRNDAKDLVHAARMDYWTPENTESQFPRPSAGTLGTSANNSLESTYWLLDGRYIRLKSVNLGFDLMKLNFMQQQDYIGSCQLVFSGLNLLTLSDTMDFFDPESAKTGNGKASTIGYPVAKVYSVGLNIQF